MYRSDLDRLIEDEGSNDPPFAWMYRQEALEELKRGDARSALVLAALSISKAIEEDG